MAQGAVFPEGRRPGWRPGPANRAHSPGEHGAHGEAPPELPAQRPPQEVLPPTGPRKYGSRRELVHWLAQELAGDMQGSLWKAIHSDPELTAAAPISWLQSRQSDRFPGT